MNYWILAAMAAERSLKMLAKNDLQGYHKFKTLAICIYIDMQSEDLLDRRQYAAKLLSNKYHELCKLPQYEDLK